MTTHTNNPAALTLADGTVAIQGSGGNTGGAAGRYADALPVTGTGAVTCETDHGDRVWRFNGPASSVARWDWTGMSTPRAAIEVELEGAAAPTGGDCNVGGLHNGSAYAARVEHRTDGTLRVFNAAGQSLHTSPAVPPAAGWRYYLGVEIGTGTGDGEIHFALYTASDGHGTTPADVYDSSTANAGTANLTAARMGKVTTAPAAVYDVRYLRLSDSSYAAIGPLETSPPTVAYTIGQTTQVDFSGSTGTAPLTLTSVTQASGPSVGTITIAGLVASFTEPVGRSQSVVLDYTLTDADGSASGQIVVAPPVQRSGDRILVDGNWI